MKAQKLDGPHTSGEGVKILTCGMPTPISGKATIWDVEGGEVVNGIGFKFSDEVNSLMSPASHCTYALGLMRVPVVSATLIERTLSNDWNQSICVSRKER